MYFDLNLDGKVFLRNQSEFSELLVSCVQGNEIYELFNLGILQMVISV